MTSPNPSAHGPTVRRRNGPRQRISAQVPDLATQEFRAHTAGLSNRLPLKSLESMRAGTIMSPHGLVRRYLVSARSIGLPKEWAVRFHVWLGRQIDALWPQDCTPTRTLEEREMARESADNILEKRCDLERTIEAKRARIDSLTAEITAETLVVARLQREVEQAQ